MLTAQRSNNRASERNTSSSSSDCDKSQNLSDIRRKFLEQSDASLALKLQNDEFSEKKEWNKATRLTARIDAPLARLHQTEEEKRVEQERLERLEKLKIIIEQDRKIAKQLQAEEREGIERDRRRRESDQSTNRDRQHADQATRSLSINDASQRTKNRSNHVLKTTGRSLDSGIGKSKHRTTGTESETGAHKQEYKPEASNQRTSSSSSKSTLEREIDRNNDEINRALQEKERLEEMMQSSTGRDTVTESRARQRNQRGRDGNGLTQPGRVKVTFKEEVIIGEVDRTDDDESSRTLRPTKEPPVYAIPGRGGTRNPSAQSVNQSSRPNHSAEDENENS